MQNYQTEIANGRLWRAKEIILGRVASNSEFDPLLHEELGKVLLRMGDELEAGRHLFTSGKREASYEPAIGYFFNRFCVSTSGFISELPNSLFRAEYESWPDGVRAEIKRRDLNEEKIRNAVLKKSAKRGQEQAESKVRKIGCGIVVIATLLAMVGIFSIGIMTIFSWIF